MTSHEECYQFLRREGKKKMMGEMVTWICKSIGPLLLQVTERETGCVPDDPTRVVLSLDPGD
jgi:hypothetical protein